MAVHNINVDIYVGRHIPLRQWTPAVSTNDIEMDRYGSIWGERQVPNLGSHFDLYSQYRKRIKNVRRGKRLRNENIILPVAYSLILQGSNRAEFRARIKWSPKAMLETAQKAKHVDRTSHTTSDRAWQWVEVNREAGFTGAFLLSFSDGTIHAQIITHDFIESDSLDRLREDVAQTLADWITMIRRI